MKKHTTILLIILFVSLSCTHDKRKAQYKIGVSQCSDDAWRRNMNEEILREASFFSDVDVAIKTAFDSNQKQIRDIESFIAEKVDLIIVSPNEAVPLTPVIEKAMLEGIPVVLVDRKTSNSKYTAFVGADNYQIGKEVGVYTANLLNGKGNVVEIRGLKGSTPDKERHEGFVSIINNYPDIKIVYENNADWLRSQAKEKMTEAIQKFQSIDLVFAHNDEMATGAHEALRVTSGVKPPIIIGIDALPGTDGGIQKVINGTIDATFIYPTGGEKAVQTAIRILKNEPYDRENILYTAVVDKTNARVLKLQTDQIIQHQNRIGLLNTVLDQNLAQYSAQRVLLYFSFAVLFVILVLLLLLFRLYKHKNKVNRELELTNIEISKQKEELSEQRDQLISLSKNLEEATQAKLMFFTNISHEFRTPLTLLYGPLESILKNEKLSVESTNLAKIMYKNVQVLMKLIDQIIDFRRYENGKMQTNFTFSDLNAFLNNICNSFLELAKKRRIHLSYSAVKEDFTLWFDSDKMEKICYNLLSNALKFTPQNGSVKVHLEKVEINEEYHVKLIVADTGVGISEQHIHQIFGRFYQVDKNISGSGIGLALTKVLVELHNGTIEIESIEGKGSSFYITIPFKQKDISLSEQYPVLNIDKVKIEDTLLFELDDFDTVLDETKHVSDKPLVLLVDDNADVRQYLKSLLRTDFEIIEAVNGQQGVLKAIKQIPELIISDVMMNVMSGFELCKHIKENITTSHIPVMLLTACAQDEQRAQGFECGADAYIPKPFNEDLLKIRVRKIIENREKVKAFFQKNLTFGDRKENVTEIDKTFMAKFQKIIENNLNDSDLNVDEIGKSLGLSRVQLYRKLKSLTNYAPNELVRIIRLKVAEQMLINTEKTISEVAYDTGFTSPSYFTKCFKEYFNENPTEYMKLIRTRNYK